MLRALPAAFGCKLLILLITRFFTKPNKGMILLSNGQPIEGIPLITKMPNRQRIVQTELLSSVLRTTIVKAMKLTAIFLLCLLMRVHATGYAQKVTLTVRDASLESVLKKITKQTGYVFFYNDQIIQKAQPVSVILKNVQLEQALKAVFKEQPFRYMISDKNIAVGLAIVQAKPASDTTVPKRNPRIQMLKVIGKIYDASTGAPLAGVNVIGVGTQSGTVSGPNGDFLLAVPKGLVVEFTAIGYEAHREKLMADNTNMLVRLKLKPTEMKQMVVTGIFSRKSSSFTGAAVTITGEELRKVGNANVFQSLKNLVPSMVLDNFTAGSNPNAMPTIQLRGTSTFPADESDIQANLKGNYLKSPNEPLFILDGFEASIERILDLDMNRIERMDILKDAASKAIYGARGANGVIVIETKKSATGRALVTYNASVDVDIPDLTSYNLANSHEKLQAELIDGMYIAPKYEPDTWVRLQQLYNTRKKLADEGLYTNWLAKPLREGVGHKHNLSIDLSGPSLSLLADFTYREVNGVMIGSQRKNISSNLNASYRVKNFLFRNIMSISKNNNTESPYGQFSDFVKMNPYWKSQEADGTIPFYSEYVDADTRYTNPMYNGTINTKNTTGYFNFTDNFYVEWNIIPGLKAITRLGFDIKNTEADEFYPASHTRFDIYWKTDSAQMRKGSYQINNGKSTRVSGDLNLQYSRNLGVHNFWANLGVNAVEQRLSELYHVVEGFTSDRMENVMFGNRYLLDSRPQGIEMINRELGVLGSFSYTYNNRYFTDLTLRSSASSQFGSDKRWAQFWSVGLGWNLHNEDFFVAGLPFVNQFKLRGSMGSTGNPNFATNASVATYEYYRDRLYQDLPGSYLTNLPNPDLQWETKMDYNIGADISIHHRLNLRFDYYESYTENLVTRLTLPSSTGFTSVAENLGRVRNNGIELNANWMLWNKGNNFFSIYGSIETNRNRIVELSGAMKDFNNRMDAEAAKLDRSTPVKKYIDGMSMNTIWAVPSLGIDPSTGREIYVKRDGSTTFNWDPSDMVAAGNSLPEFTGTFGISGEYKGFGLNITGRFLGGSQLYNQTLVDRVENVDMAYNVDKRVITGRWLYPGQQALFKRLGTFTKTLPDGSSTIARELTRSTTRFVQDRNEWTIGAINAYYQFREAVSKRLGMQRLRIGVNMNEIATFSTIRIERGTSYPFARTLSFSLSATF